jgi:hypothetical protein
VAYPAGAYTGPTVTSAGWAVNPGIINTLHSQGRYVICYVVTGAWESYRPDAGAFPVSVIGKSTGWDGEDWLDIRKAAWPKFEWIIVNRLLLARESGCNGIEADQNNPVGNDPGFPISYSDEKAWYLEVARDAHALGLTILMKNGIELLPDSTLIAAFDGALTEQCYQYSECSALHEFVAAGKWVGDVEYQGAPSIFCPILQADGLMGMEKDTGLDAWRIDCWG